MSVQYQPGTQNRVAALDVAKAIGIVLVIFGHITRNDKALSLIYSFHMPLFFFLSGITANFNRDHYVLRKFRTLMVPYFIWAVVFLLYWFLFERKFRGQAVDPFIPLQGAFFGFCKGDYLIPNIVLWFLPSLFGVECLAYFINKFLFLKKIQFQLIGLLAFHLISWLITSYASTVSFPYCIETVFIAMPFYMVGVYLQDRTMNFLRETKLFSILSFCLVGLLVLFFFPANPVDIRLSIVGNYWFFYIKACAGILAVISIAQLFQTNKIVVIIGQSTLPLMIFHDPLKRIMLSLISKISHLQVDDLRQSIFISLIFACLIIALIIPLKIVIERIFPQSLGKSRASAYNLKAAKPRPGS